MLVDQSAPVLAKMPLADYLALPAVSSSRLWTLHSKSPWHAQNDRDSASEAKSLGSLLHALVLEPETVGSRFHRFDGECRTKEKKAEWEDAEKRGLEVVRSGAWDKAEEEAESVRRAAGDLVARATHREVVMRWDEAGTEAKARPDLVLPSLLADLKRVSRTGAGHPSSFRTACKVYGHHWQAAWYCRGARAVLGIEPMWCWIVHEAGGPTAVYEATRDDLHRIEREVVDALERWKFCAETREWPGYESGPIDLSGLYAIDESAIELAGLETETEDDELE